MSREIPVQRPDFFTFQDIKGFTPHISRLVYMLNYVRSNTLSAVMGLRAEQIDIHVLSGGNTIGMLLAHIAGIERSYQAVTFRHERLPPDLPEFQLGEIGRKHFRGYDLDFYLERLASARADTLSELQRRDDEWLHQIYKPWGRDDWNNYFCWFHVMEDELRHQGQIVILRKSIERAE